MKSPSATTIFICDELDKIPVVTREERPIDLFHSLLERENAKAFEDQFLGLPIRADRAIWFFTANSIATIPSSILDRLLVISCAPLSDAQREQFVLRLVRRAMIDCGNAFSIKLNHAMITALAKMPTRQLIRVIDVAMGLAATDGRQKVTDADFNRASRVCSGSKGEQCAKMGFI